MVIKTAFNGKNIQLFTVGIIKLFDAVTYTDIIPYPFDCPLLKTLKSIYHGIGRWSPDNLAVLK